MASLIHIEPRYGKPVQADLLNLTPVAQKIEIGRTGVPLRMIWIRPRAVRVRYPDGRLQSIPIPDPTRHIQIGLLLGGLVMGIAALTRKRSASRRGSVDR
jgi:hypothetical protein